MNGPPHRAHTGDLAAIRREVRRRRVGVLAIALVWMQATTGFAVRPGQWTHRTEAELEPGKTENVVITNLGDVKLAAATESLAEAPEQATIIYDLQRTADGTLYLAAGPEGKLLKLEGDKLVEVLTVTDEQIFCLDLLGGRLLAGVSGNGSSRLALLGDAELETVAELAEVRYVFDTIVVDSVIFAATGTEGRLIRVDTAGEGEPAVDTVLDAAQENLLCLGRDGRGALYAGSDGEGLIYRVTFDADGAASAFALYDAAEPEIGTMLVREDGTIFAGTADAKQAKPGRLKAAAKTTTGRPAPKPEAKPDVKAEPKPDAAPAQAAPPTEHPAGKVDAEPDAKEEAGAAEAPTATEDEASDGDEPAPDAPATKPESNTRRPRVGFETRPLRDIVRAAADTPAAPTTKQYDELRQIIRQRLEAAKESGQIEPLQADPAIPQPAARQATPPPPSRPKAVKPSKKGNAIYRISADGFVREVFRESVMILKIVDFGGKLLVGTGNDGQLYSVDVEGQETAILSDLEPQQVPAMLSEGQNVVLGTANPATLLRIDGGFAREGTYTSDVLDAAQISLWGRMHLTVQTPPNTSVAVDTRSGNVKDPEQAAWSQWSSGVFLENDAGASPMAPREVTIESPPGRFFQYRLTFEGDGQATASVNRLDMKYVTPNLQPKIQSVKASYAGGSSKSSASSGSSGAAKGTPKHVSVMKIEWKACDPYKDKLSYDLEYLPDGSDRWLPLAEELTAGRYQWKTELVPDGRYTVRVTASDVPDNTPGMEQSVSRDSDPVVVDNTEPALDGLQAQVEGGIVTITGTAVDRMSTVSSIHYMVDGKEPWRAVLPKDMIYDSTEEAFVATIENLEAGDRVIALRVVDSRKNSRYEHVIVQVP